MQKGIDGKRNLLAEEMLRYFGETCPALVGVARSRSSVYRCSLDER